jgi:hypothetical protein
MNDRLTEISERREFLVAQSHLERDRAALCGEHIAHFFSKNTLNRAVKSSAGSVIGIFILRWLGKKLASKIGSFLGHEATRVATGFWRRRRP